MKKVLLVFFVLLAGTQLSAQSTDGLSLVFQDDFSNNKNAWLVNETGKDVSWVNFNEKRLVIDSNVGEGRITMNASKGFNGDFVIKANLWCKECAGSKMASLGIMIGFDQFSLKNEQGWYGIKLTQENGKDGVWVKANNANGSTLYEQTVSTAFDPNDKNEIAIERSGDTVNYYVNGTQVFSNVATEAAGNKIAFICDNKMKVFMSDLSFWAN
jgi:hypothetical protein